MTRVFAGSLYRLIFLHGGWGKVDAAGSTQYLIDHWTPDLLINLGTCGGFKGKVNRGEIILVDRTLIYDIYELMGDPEAHIAHYTTDFDLTWLSEPYPSQVRRALLVSGDRDLLPRDIPDLISKYGALVGDWESGAIARIASRNRIPVLILRGISDLVGPEGGEAYQGDMNIFQQNAALIMKNLVDVLPAWLERWLARAPGVRPAQPPA
jgi:adenosylhomocysteine nucleosidase